MAIKNNKNKRWRVLWRNFPNLALKLSGWFLCAYLPAFIAFLVQIFAGELISFNLLKNIDVLSGIFGSSLCFIVGVAFSLKYLKGKKYNFHRLTILGVAINIVFLLTILLFDKIGREIDTDLFFILALVVIIISFIVAVSITIDETDVENQEFADESRNEKKTKVDGKEISI